MASSILLILRGARKAAAARQPDLGPAYDLPTFP